MTRKNRTSRRLLIRPNSIISVVALIVTVAILHTAFPASSAPVTSTATSKLTVYQGVITVAPGVVGDNILELGNAGRDLAGTGDIFVRPGGVSGASTNFAQFNLIAGRTYLRVPGTVTAGYLTVSPQDSNNEGGEIALTRSSGLYQDWFLDVYQGSFRLHSAGAANFVINPNSTTIQAANIDNGFHGTIIRDASGERIRTGYSNFALDNAAHSTQVAGQFFWGPGSGGSDLFGSLGIGSRGNVASGITLFTSPGTGLQPRLRVANNGDVYVISGALCFGNAPGNCSNTWAAAATPTLDQVLSVANGNRSDQSVGLGSDTVIPAAGLVVNRGGMTGTGSAGDAIAVYANSANSAIFAQQNNTAGWAGYFSGRVNIGGDLVYKGRLKPTPGLQVCQVGTDTCLGQYLYSTGSTRNTDVSTGIRYFYDNGSFAIPVFVFTSQIVPTCAADETLTNRGLPPAPESLFSTTACSPNTGEYVRPGVSPYGNPATQVCVNNTTLPVTIIRFQDNFGCQVTGPTSISVRRVSAMQLATVFVPAYELR